MSDLGLSIEATQNAVTGTQPTASNDESSRTAAPIARPQPQVLITEQQVMFGTAAAVRPRSIKGRMTGALHAVATALRAEPDRSDRDVRPAWYLESSRMSREMGRL